MARVDIPVRTTGAKKAEAAFKKLGSSIQGMVGAALGMGAAIKVFGFFKESVDKSSEQELIFRKLATSIKLAGQNYQSIEGDLSAYLEILQRTTEYGDTDSAKVLTTLVQLTGSYDKALKALPLALDIAGTGLFDINTAARNVAMSLSGNIELMARYIPELKASVTPFLKTATAAEKAEFAINILNEKFGGTAQENVKTYAGEMKQLGNRMDDVQEKVGDLYTKLAQDTGVLRLQELALRYLTESWLNLSPAVMTYNLLFGETEKTTEELKASINGVAGAVDDSGDSIDKVKTKYEEWVEALEAAQALEVQELDFWNFYATNMGLIATETLPMLTGEVAKLTTEFEDQLKPMKKIHQEMDKFAPQLGELSANVQKVGNQLTSTFDYIFTESLVRGQNFFDSFLAGFVGMLEQMVAAMMARAAVFSIFEMLGYGSILSGGKSMLSFITGFQHGGSFTVGGSGGPDSQMVAFKASPGERVNITPEGHTSNDNSIVINVHGSIDPVVYKRDLKPLLNKINRGIAV